VVGYRFGNVSLMWLIDFPVCVASCAPDLLGQKLNLTSSVVYVRHSDV
jgi:hypothetical protein